MKKIVISFIAIAAAFVNSVSKANAEIIKYRFYINGDKVYVITDNPADSKYLILSPLESKKAFISDKCGVGIIKLNNVEMAGDGPYYLDNIQLDNRLADTLQEGVAPKYQCDNQINNVQNAGYFQRAAKGNNYTFIIGNLQPEQAYSFGYLGVTRAYIKMDSCGIGKFNSNILGEHFRMDYTENDISKISNTYYKSRLTKLSAPPICRNGSLYLPI